MAKKHTITITKPEAYDILCLIETNKREGWCAGRRDYWEKHLVSVEEQLNKVITFLDGYNLDI